MEFAELTLVVQDNENVRVMRNDGAETGGKLILDDLRRSTIDLFEDWLSQGKISRRRELEVFGTLLYRVLFNGQVEGFFEQSLVDARRAKQRLRVQLSFEENAADLASIPWEYLYYPDTETHAGFFVATHVDLVLSRYMPLAIARQALAPSQGPLRILIAVSKPQELGPVISEPVIEAIQNFAETYPIQIDILDKPTIENFLDELDETKPHVLHFIGHGQFNRAEGKGEIALLDVDETSVRWIRDREFTEFFIQMHSVPHLAFLHLCEGGAIDFNANFAGLAPQLVRAGIQAVVAMQHPISNNAAIIFSRVFYRELAKGAPIDTAVQDGRWRITTSIPRAYDDRVFGTPVLYMRSRDGIIQPPAVTVSSDGT
jgi:hypothetical protein